MRKGIVFDGVDEALRVPNTELRLFGKPESFVKRRMGVALAFDADVEVARTQRQAGGVQSQAAQGLNRKFESNRRISPASNGHIQLLKM